MLRDVGRILGNKIRSAKKGGGLRWSVVIALLRFLLATSVYDRFLHFLPPSQLNMFNFSLIFRLKLNKLFFIYSYENCFSILTTGLEAVKQLKNTDFTDQKFKITDLLTKIKSGRIK